MSRCARGRVNIITSPNNFLDLGRAGFLSPTGQCKPFDEKGDGYCRADGAGLVVLKSLDRAQADGDHIMAVIPAVATNQGGLSSGLTVPDSKAQEQLYRSVLTKAAMDPAQVTYVEAHGTGTPSWRPSRDSQCEVSPRGRWQKRRCCTSAPSREMFGHFRDRCWSSPGC